MLETQVFQLVLHPPDSDPVRQRRVNLQGLLGDFLPLGLAQMLERPHIVKTIRQLDDDDADIVRHRQHHFSKILRLLLFIAPEGDLADLRHPVDKMDDLFPEFTLQLGRCRHRIFQSVVQQSRHHRRHIGLEQGQHAGHRNGMLHVRLAGPAFLPLVRFGGKVVRLAQQAEIGLGLIAPHAIEQLADIGDGFIDHRCVTP